MKSRAAAADKIRPSQVMKDGACGWTERAGAGGGVGVLEQNTAFTLIKVNEKTDTFSYVVAL